jgi:hypothetical protein
MKPTKSEGHFVKILQFQTQRKHKPVGITKTNGFRPLKIVQTICARMYAAAFKVFQFPHELFTPQIFA